METYKRNKIIDIVVILLIFLAFVSFPINLIIKDLMWIRIVQILLKLVAGGIVFAYVKISKYLKLVSEKTNWKNLLILLPMILLLPNNIYYLAIEKDLIGNYYEPIIIVNIVSSLVTAFVEEFIFRKILFNNIEVKKPLLKILLISGIFAVFHFSTFLSTFNAFDLLQVVYTFGLGMVLGFIYQYGKNLYFCIAFHFLFNFINTDLFALISSQEVRLSFFFVAIATGVVIGLVLLFEYLFYFRKLTEEEESSVTL